MLRKFFQLLYSKITFLIYIRVVLNQFTVEACVEVKSSEMVYLNLECVLCSAHMDARSGVIAGDLHLKDTKFEG